MGGARTKVGRLVQRSRHEAVWLDGEAKAMMVRRARVMNIFWRSCQALLMDRIWVHEKRRREGVLEFWARTTCRLVVPLTGWERLGQKQVCGGSQVSSEMAGTPRGEVELGWDPELHSAYTLSWRQNCQRVGLMRPHELHREEVAGREKGTKIRAWVLPSIKKKGWRTQQRILERQGPQEWN